LLYLGARAHGDIEFIEWEIEYASNASQEDNAGATVAAGTAVAPDGQIDFSHGYMVHGDVGITVEDVEGSPRIGFEYDMGAEEWVSLFPTNHARFGWANMSLSASNLIHTEVNAYFGIYDGWRFGAEYHWLRAFRQPGSDDLGSELDFVLKGKCGEHLWVLIAAGQHFGGKGLTTFDGNAAQGTNVPLYIPVTAANTRHNTTFGYLEITVPF